MFIKVYNSEVYKSIGSKDLFCLNKSIFKAFSRDYHEIGIQLRGRASTKLAAGSMVLVGMNDSFVDRWILMTAEDYIKEKAGRTK